MFPVVAACLRHGTAVQIPPAAEGARLTEHRADGRANADIDARRALACKLNLHLDPVAEPDRMGAINELIAAMRAAEVLTFSARTMGKVSPQPCERSLKF